MDTHHDRVELGLIGPLRVDQDGTGLGPRDRVVLSALAVHSRDGMSAGQLADALWQEAPPDSWLKVVQGCVMRIRKSVGTTAIQTTATGYRLDVNLLALDTRRFETLIRAGREQMAVGMPERAVASFTRALELWRGQPFEDLADWPPARFEAERLSELRRTVQEDLLEARLESGEHREAAADGVVLVAEEPWRERRWSILALAQYRCGRQADALASIRRARRTLGNQLGIDLGSELVGLEAAILAHDPGLAATVEQITTTAACPYKGLAAYDADDSDTFFGRDADVTACLQRLTTSPVLILAGPSGSGKSSLLRAGLLPALQATERLGVLFMPGSDPEAAMATACASVSGHPLLLIDQFEEVFTLGVDPEVTRSWVAHLAAYAADTAPVVLVVQAAYLAGLAIDPTFARQAERGLYLVGPLEGDALRLAVEGPAARAGLWLENGLVDLLGRDAEGEPGALPLLSHALVETWQAREGRVLTVEGYQQTGGIRGAVARTADRLYESLPEERRAIVRWVLLRLVTTSESGEPVRTRVPSRTLRGDPERAWVVDLLVRARLLTMEEDKVGLAHVALARAWPRLRSWLEDDAAGQRILRHLSAAAEGWEALAGHLRRIDSCVRRASPQIRPERPRTSDATCPSCAPVQSHLIGLAHRDRRVCANRHVQEGLHAYGACCGDPTHDACSRALPHAASDQTFPTPEQRLWGTANTARGARCSWPPSARRGNPCAARVQDSGVTREATRPAAARFAAARARCRTV